MSDNKYTPGPWIIEKAMDGSANFAVSSKEGDCYNWQELSTVYNNHSVKEESAANVKLIAAAPDMIEALKNIYAEVTIYNGLHPDNLIGLNEVESAIEKATK